MSLLLLFITPDELLVTTQAASGITTTGAVLNGTIENTGSVNPTTRGFQYGTVPTVDIETVETGDFSAAAFTKTISGLTAGQLYYFRAYATNTNGTVYGSWVTFTATPATYNVTINAIDRTKDILANSIVIEDAINDQSNILNFSLIDRSGNGMPSTDQEITITLNSGTKIFGGYILSVNLTKLPNGVVQGDFVCTDYVRLFDRNLVNKTYEDKTDKEIIEDIVLTYCQGFGITTTNVLAGVIIDQISFNYVQPSQALRKLADLTGRNWYIDYSKDIHFFPLSTNATPFNITSSQNQYIDLQISKDASQLKNRVYVRGGTKLSDSTTYSVKGDGVARKFPLPDKPHNNTVKVNSVTKTLGIKNVDTSGFDFYLNFQEKYLEQDSGGTVLSTSDTLELTYAYDIPILVAVEDTASIISNGVKEFAIFDNKITTNQAARDRASAELTDYANSIIEGGFKTYTDGLISGQFININLSEYGVNASYIVQKVVCRSFGAGNYEYTIYIASAKTMGIIRFLIELLEDQKNILEIDNNEVVDELLSVTDSLLSDSIVDSLTIDSAGPYQVWGGGGNTQQGPLSPGTTADDSTVGSLSWTNPDNVKVSDDSYATITTS